MTLYLSITGCMRVTVDVEYAWARGIVRAEPTALENGDVHAVAGSPSMAWAAVASGSPVSRRFDSAVVRTDKSLSSASDARSLRRSVIRVVKSRSELTVNWRISRGS